MLRLERNMNKLKFPKNPYKKKPNQYKREVLSIEEYQKIISKKNKYNAKTQNYTGRKYHSALEANYAAQLDIRKKAKEIKEIIPQYKIDIRVNGIHICNYYMDFKLIMTDHTIEMHEVKGFATDLWRIKWRLAIALYPEWKFVLVK